MFLVLFKSKQIIKNLIGATPEVLLIGQVKLIWPEMWSNAFKMPIKLISMQSKYNLSWYKPWMIVFKQFSRKHCSGMPDWNVLYTSECVLDITSLSPHSWVKPPVPRELWTTLCTVWKTVFIVHCTVHWGSQHLLWTRLPPESLPVIPLRIPLSICHMENIHLMFP